MKPHKNDKTTVALKTAGNPDGKGGSDTMLDWYQAEPRGVVAKPPPQVLAEYFTSMLVLGAHFKYKPAIGAPNYLYCIDGNWQLSLIAPEQWSDEHRAGFIGTCHLQADMTWTIRPSDQLSDDKRLSDRVGQFFDAFVDTLDTDAPLEDTLPYFAKRMPYWQRLHASGLSRSIRATVALGSQQAITARDWRRALPTGGNALLLDPAVATSTT